MPISEKPWSDYTAADYSIEQWHAACLVHLHDGTPTSKSECKLPVRTPTGALNRGGVHAAAAALAGARTPMNAPPEKKKAAARKLLSLYRELDEEAPDSIKQMATRSLEEHPMETRSLIEAPEFRSNDGKLVAAGVAMRYGAKSKPIRGQFREQFTPGAFTKTLKEQDIHAHNEHDGPYLARSGAGTLRLTDTRSELAYEIDLPDTTAGRDAAALLERGDIKGSSIGFRAIPAAITWTVDDDGMALRTVGEAMLGRVDLTIAPYYDDSTAEMALRSFADDKGLELRSVLDAARDGRLPSLILADVEQLRGDGRETTDRERIIWLYA